MKCQIRQADKGESLASWLVDISQGYFKQACNDRHSETGQARKFTGKCEQKG
jgi:hypothetical protein